MDGGGEINIFNYRDVSSETFLGIKAEHFQKSFIEP